MIRKLWLLLYNLSIMLPVIVLASFIYRNQFEFSITFTFLSIFIVCFSIIFPRIADNSSSDTISISSISPNDSFHECIVSYTLPLLSFVFGLGPEYFVILLVIICIFMYISDSRIPNPLLRIMGYHFYSIDLEDGIHGYMLISKLEIFNSKQITSGKLISNYIIISTDARR